MLTVIYSNLLTDQWGFQGWWNLINWIYVWYYNIKGQIRFCMSYKSLIWCVFSRNHYNAMSLWNFNVALKLSEILFCKEMPVKIPSRAPVFCLFVCFLVFLCFFLFLFLFLFFFNDLHFYISNVIDRKLYLFNASVNVHLEPILLKLTG